MRSGSRAGSSSCGWSCRGGAGAPPPRGFTAIASRRARIWRDLKPFASLMPGLVVYGVLRVVFAHVVGSHGFATPAGVPNQGLAVFALVMLVMRIAVLVLVPLIVTYRIVRRLFTLGQGRCGGTRTDDAPGS